MGRLRGGAVHLETTEFLLRIVAALGMGVAIGIERQLGQHPAGVRTNALVCLGSALFVTLSAADKSDSTRIAGQIVSGIGFLGGGVILREGITVRGMNTAATLWCSAAIGTLAGFGYILYALIGTLAVLSSHFLFRPLAHVIDVYTQGKGEMELLYEVKIVCRRTKEKMVRGNLIEQIATTKLRLQGLTLEETPSPDQVEMLVRLYAYQHNEQAMNDLVSRLASQPEVFRVSWGKAT
jgi:putative Mg2+ transporter-C (MgtC) family protein